MKPFLYCDNCRKIKGWAQSADSIIGECTTCKTGNLLLNVSYLPMFDPEITECPDPCQGNCKLCPLPASLTSPGEDNGLGTLGAEIGDMLAKPEEKVQTLDDILKKHTERQGETRVDVDGGKYTVVMPDNGGLYALRHGERWRDLVGDGLVWCLAAELDKARKEIKELENRTGGQFRGVTFDIQDKKY